MSAFAALAVTDPGVGAPAPLLAAMDAALHDSRARIELGDASSDEVLAVLAALVPEARRLQADLGIAPEVTADTLIDVGAKHRTFGARTEVPWLLGLLRGDVLSMGRLQVERRADAGAHRLHVPERGPLAPAAVDESLDRARTLMGATRFVCTSWLLDPVLSERLPASNIASFARRFALDPTSTGPSAAGAGSAAKFVFAATVGEVRDAGRVTPRTRLETLVAERLRSGSGWAEPTGTFTQS